MSLWLEIPLTFICGSLLWALGTVVFDTAHWVLHSMLRSRWRLLRALAWPHSVHHEWLDRTLAIRWENQWKNVWCHLVPEYLTQVAFAGLTWLILPGGIVATCIALQTAVFAGLLSYRGLDINHRAVEILDAYRPSAFAVPAYHALHHVYPDAYFSAYSKLVDWMVGGGAQLRGRRFAMHGAATPFGCALRGALAPQGVSEVIEIDKGTVPPWAELDVLVLCDPSLPESPWVEAFIQATRARQLPPEVWSVHTEIANGCARYYYGDVRVLYRNIVLPDATSLTAHAAGRAANVVLFFVRRGLNYVPATVSLSARRGFRRFVRTAPEHPAGATRVRTRAAACSARATMRAETRA